MDIFNNAEGNENPIVEIKNSVMAKTFIWVAIALLVSSIAAFATYKSESLVLYRAYPVLIMIELVVVIGLSFGLRKMPLWLSATLFMTYSILNGITFSALFYVYELGSIATIFIETAAVFAVLAVLGYTTNVDLQKWSIALSVMLCVGLFVSIINLIIGSSMIQIGLTWAMLILFFVLVIYDTQKIKVMASEGMIEDNKLAIYGAMQLYLDFINIFIRILALFGKRK